MKEEGRRSSEAYAVFLRAANVGGHQVFKPSALARNLSSLGCKSIGAAGTFVFRKASSEAGLRSAIAKALPFEPQMAVVRANQVDKLVASLPFGPSPLGPGEKAFVSALVAKPTVHPRFPISRPETGPWQLRILALNGPFALSVRRVKVAGRFYPNEVVEKAFGAPATTRGWSTIEAVRRALHVPA